MEYKPKPILFLSMLVFWGLIAFMLSVKLLYNFVQHTVFITNDVIQTSPDLFHIIIIIIITLILTYVSTLWIQRYYEHNAVNIILAVIYLVLDILLLRSMSKTLIMWLAIAILTILVIYYIIRIFRK